MEENRSERSANTTDNNEKRAAANDRLNLAQKTFLLFKHRPFICSLLSAMPCALATHSSLVQCQLLFFT